jgi:hypothetical protein
MLEEYGLQQLLSSGVYEESHFYSVLQMWSSWFYGIFLSICQSNSCENVFIEIEFRFFVHARIACNCNIEIYYFLNSFKSHLSPLDGRMHPYSCIPGQEIHKWN